MKIFAETNRLILREILPSDDQAMFRLDSDPEVHTYLGNNPISNISQSREMINFIREQYHTNGIGRWAVVEKETDIFVGWAGLKLIKEEMNGHQNFYDLGYRLIRQYWGKGFATEAGRASLTYAFNQLKLPVVYAMAHAQNKGSQHVLEKLGFIYRQTFKYQELPTFWYSISPGSQMPG